MTYTPGEMQGMTWEEASFHIIGKNVDTLTSIGALADALHWKWVRLARLEKGGY